MGINHLAHFALTLELLPLLRKSAPHSPIGARIVSVVSLLHILAALPANNVLQPRGVKGLQAYADSKCAQILFTRLLRRLLQHEPVHCFAVHPGEVLTDIARDVPGWLFRAQAKIGPLILFDVWQGARWTSCLSTSARLRMLNATARVFAQACLRMPLHAHHTRMRCNSTFARLQQAKTCLGTVRAHMSCTPALQYAQAAVTMYICLVRACTEVVALSVHNIMQACGQRCIVQPAPRLCRKLSHLQATFIVIAKRILRMLRPVMIKLLRDCGKSQQQPAEFLRSMMFFNSRAHQNKPCLQLDAMTTSS